MPPQTHLKIAHDATRRGLDRPSAAAKAGRGVLHAPRPDAPIAAQRGAASEKDAAGPPGVAVPGFFGWLARQWIAFRESRRRRMMRLHLRDLSEAQLIDIGLNRGDIEHIAAHRALEKLKDSTARLMISRGVMQLRAPAPAARVVDRVDRLDLPWRCRNMSRGTVYLAGGPLRGNDGVEMVRFSTISREEA